jgi:hypothetical protein
MLKRVFIGLLCIICCSAHSGVFAQGSLSADASRQLKQMEDSLVTIADSMYNSYLPDERPDFCIKFVKHLVRALKVPNSYDYPFNALKKKINIIAPDDNAFRIFNWQVIPEVSQVRYYGAIQAASESLKLYPLVDYTTELGKSAEDSVLTNSKWFGALYYRILTNDVDGHKVYTLFGLNSSSPVSNRKVMDPLSFTEHGAVFGAPIFNVSSQAIPNQRINRFIIEYKKQVQASLNWDDELKMVYFDKLVSQANDPNRKYTYVPSGQYDGFRWAGGTWNYVQDLIPVQNFKDGEAPDPKPLKPK